MILGHDKLWWTEKYVQLKFRRNRGNAMTGEMKGLWQVMTGGSVIILMVDRVFHVLLPIWILPAALVFQWIGEYFLGKLDQKVLHLWQAEMEYQARKGIDNWSRSQMEMIREIHKNICPDSKLNPKVYIKEE